MDQPVSDPFAEVGVARQFDVDLSVVRRRQADLMRQWHPDRAPSAGVVVPGGVDAAECGARAAAVNAAVAILVDPARRADALLSLLDPDGRDPALSSDLLARTLEARVELADGGAEARGRIEREAALELKQCVDRFAEALRVGCAYSDARAARVAWRYWSRLLMACRGEDSPEASFRG